MCFQSVPLIFLSSVLEQQLEVIVLPLEDKVVLANLLYRSECYMFKLYYMFYPKRLTISAFNHEGTNSGIFS